MGDQARGGPLQGVRVLEGAKVWAGPFAGKQLAFLGAEVIKVESRGSLDLTRFYGGVDIDHAPGFQAVNPQKLGCTIDMKSKAGLQLLLDLAAECDVLVENLRPGAIDRLGLGYEAVKAVRPDIVFVSMGMYGNEGPLAYQTGYAPCFVALGGVSNLVGYEGRPPQGMNIRYCDSSFGTAAAYATVVALTHRRRTGEGQFVDLSAVETASSMIGDSLMDYALNGRVASADGSRHAEMAPHGTYPCLDGDWISLAVASDAAWGALCGVMGQPGLADDDAFATLSARKTNEADLDARLAAWTRDRDARALVTELQAAGVAAGKSANALDLVSDEHLWARGFYPVVSDCNGSSKPIVGPSWRMSEGAAITAAAPQLGEHNAYVFGDILGLSTEAQQRLAEAGAIR